jgi:hypothetical protein
VRQSSRSTRACSSVPGVRAGWGGTILRNVARNLSRDFPGNFSRVVAALLPVLLQATVLLLAASATAVLAHERSASHSVWQVDDDGASVTLRLEGRELTRLPEASRAGGDLALLTIVADALTASRGGEPCIRTDEPMEGAAAKGYRMIRWRLECPAGGVFQIESRLPQVMRAAHLAFVRGALPDGTPFEAVLHADGPTWTSGREGDAALGPTLADSLRLGIEHIATGIDHLFFVFGLVVVAATMADVAIVITAFTLAHSVTLALTTLGWLRPAAASVEALIAVSIALIAVENLTLRAGRSLLHPALAAALLFLPALAMASAGLGRVPLWVLVGTGLFAASYLTLAARRPAQTRVRWLVAFAFGLLHGFGFAGALVESGFSTAGLAPTRVGFNAGVELGQLLFVAAVWPLLVWVRRRGEDFSHRFVVEPVSALLLAAAIGWYATRTFGV